jgi:hypothetical protein
MRGAPGVSNQAFFMRKYRPSDTKEGLFHGTGSANGNHPNPQ